MSRERFWRWLFEAVRQQRARLDPLMQRPRFARLAYRGYERVLALSERSAGPDAGLPVPPALLRVGVIGVPPRESFLQTGREAAASLTGLFARSGLELADSRALLDFGCGCGRVARHWRLPDVDVHGCDYNPELIGWVAANLPHVTALRNGPEPPAPYPDERFGAIYAISVLTHLGPEAQRAWIGDLARILRPGGRLLFTTHGDTLAHLLDNDERARYDEGLPVTRYIGAAGSNLCAAFHPRAWVETLTAGLHVELVHEGGAPGLGEQDVWIVSR